MRLTMTQDLPPLMTPFVLIADIDSAVIVVTAVVVSINKKPSMMPACPTTQLRRRKSITPHIFSRQRMSTPLIQPNLRSPLVLPASGSRLRCRLCVFCEKGKTKSDLIKLHTVDR